MELLERDQAAAARTPVIMVTGENVGQIAAEAIRRGATDYVVKFGDYLFTIPLVVEKNLTVAKVKRENELLRTELEQALREVRDKNAQLEQSLKRVEEMAATDPLTGLYNRRHFGKVLEQLFAEAQRYDKDLACVMIDLDGFKQLNDSYGHQVGDQLLVDGGQGDHREPAADGRRGALRRRRVRPAAAARRRPRRPRSVAERIREEYRQASAVLLRRDGGRDDVDRHRLAAAVRRGVGRPARRPRRRGAVPGEGGTAATASAWRSRSRRAPDAPPRRREPSASPQRSAADGITAALDRCRAARHRGIVHRPETRRMPADAVAHAASPLALRRRECPAAATASGHRLAHCRRAVAPLRRRELRERSRLKISWLRPVRTRFLCRISVSARLTVSRAAPTAWASCSCVMCRTTPSSCGVAAAEPLKRTSVLTSRWLQSSNTEAAPRPRGRVASAVGELPDELHRRGRVLAARVEQLVARTRFESCARVAATACASYVPPSDSAAQPNHCPGPEDLGSRSSPSGPTWYSRTWPRWM